MTDLKPKRIFISHASEDKAEFAKPMADHFLTQKGIDAWLDLYEIVGGDDLVEKIWEEGFNADCMVVLLSPDFLTKKWPMNELRTAIAKKINDKFRVIPVVVRPCAVPDALASTLRFEVGKDGTIIQIADKIADIVHGVTIKPALGSAPGHVTARTLKIPGLNSADALILEAIFDDLIAKDQGIIYTRDIRPIASANQIGETAFGDSLEMLVESGWIAVNFGGMGNRIPQTLDMPPQVILTLARAKDIDVDGVTCQLAGLIINDGITDGQMLESRVACPHQILMAVIADLKASGLINHAQFIGKAHTITAVSAKFRRWFSEEC